MSKPMNDFFEKLKAGEQPSLLETIREAAGKVWDAGKPLFDHGRSELAAGIFTGQSHVMYMKGMYNEGQENLQQDQAQTLDPLEREQEGREL